MSRDKITVTHSAGAYDVVYTAFTEAMAALPEACFIVTDENVWAAWGERYPKGASVLRVPAGERSKSLERYGSLIEELAEAGADRHATIAAIGGGVVGDLAGFVAATYMRGVPFVQVPTSLLAQVDSSVGGKVAVDTPQGKNLVGAFYPPRTVFVASETLKTLPRRHFANGMAEVWKYGFILDAGLVDLLRASPAEEQIETIVRRCVQLKAEVVSGDEFDRTGRRAVLNFGHTVGHALEQVTGFESVLHGEAVSVGMAVEAELGERIGVTERGTASVVRECLGAHGLPTTHAALAHADALLQAMWRDKKVHGGELAFSLITRLGESKLVHGIPPAEVRAALLS